MKDVKKEFLKRVKEKLQMENEEVTFPEVERYYYSNNFREKFPKFHNVFIMLHNENMTLEEEYEFLKNVLESGVV